MTITIRSPPFSVIKAIQDGFLGQQCEVLLIDMRHSGTDNPINNQLRTLYAHALFHSEKLINTFETLCLICCKRRMRILGKEYATNTHSSQWLIKILEQDQAFCDILRNVIPNLKTQGIKNKMEEIISKKQTNPYGSYFLDTRTENVICTSPRPMLK